MEKALFWDFDGTIVYPNESFLDALYAALKRGGYAFPECDIRQFLHAVCTWYLPDISYTEKTGSKWWDNLFHHFNGFYAQHELPRSLYPQINHHFKEQILSCGSLKLFEDAKAALSQCLETGYANYILSNNFPELPDIIKHFGLAPYFSGYIVSSHIGYEKPRTEIFQYALNLAGNPRHSYMIGDNPIADIHGGKAAGMKTILVHSKCASEADWTCESLLEIPALLV